MGETSSCATGRAMELGYPTTLRRKAIPIDRRDSVLAIMAAQVCRYSAGSDETTEMCLIPLLACEPRFGSRDFVRGLSTPNVQFTVVIIPALLHHSSPCVPRQHYNNSAMTNTNQPLSTNERVSDTLASTWADIHAQQAHVIHATELVATPDPKRDPCEQHSDRSP